MFPKEYNMTPQELDDARLAYQPFFKLIKFKRIYLIKHNVEEKEWQLFFDERDDSKNYY